MQLQNKKPGLLFFIQPAVSAPVGIDNAPYASSLSASFYRTVLLISVIVFWTLMATAAVPAPLPDILKMDASQKSIDVGSRIQHLMDPGNTLTLNDVIQPDTPWKKAYPPRLHTGAAHDIVWVRFRVQNISLSRQTLVLNVDWPFWHLMELYVQDGDVGHNTLDAIKSVPPQKNRLPFAFEFPCLANQQLTLYLRVHSTGVLLLPLKIWQRQAYEKMGLFRNLFLGMFFGFLIAMCLYNASLSFFTQDDSYTYYAVYVLSVMLYCLAMTGVGAAYLWQGNAWLKGHSYGLFSSFSFLMATLFIRRFLRLSKVGGWLFGLSNFFAVFWILMTGLYAVYHGRWMIFCENIGAILSCVVGLVTTITLWRKGSMAAKYMTIAWTLLILATFVLMLGLAGVITYHPIIQHSQNIGFILELFLLSLALADRIKRERGEKEAAQELSIQLYNEMIQAKEREMQAQTRTLAVERAAKNELEETVNRRTRELQNTLRQLESANKKLGQMSRTDGLTGLFNRRYFDAAFEEEFKRAIRHGQPLSVIMGDIDHFKRINDTHGHQVGDQCLKAVASTWQTYLKRAGDLVARYGGEEFVSLLPNTDIYDAEKIAGQIRAAIEAANPKFGEIHIHLTISLGVSSLSFSGKDDMDALLQRADTALYDAKNQGRNRVEIKAFEPSD
nr:diguanylate cyclase [uncultured Desulfobacter sp.]